MMRHRWLIYLLPLLLTSTGASAQEVVTGLTRNRQLEGVAGMTRDRQPDDATGMTRLKGAAADEPVALPFFDDFSRDSLYPSVDRWSDLQVFVNNTFSVSQPSLGIATFDCLDEYGLLYDQASNLVFAADRLTSRTIDMAYPAGDSIWLSFLYEAGGVADMPESDDSLTLSFWAPDEERWYSVWQAAGNTTSGFRQAMIPVTDSRFLKNGFRFMFTGHASLAGVLTEPSRSGTADQWNLDHVYLDRNRSRNDTVIHDVAMTLRKRIIDITTGSNFRWYWKVCIWKTVISTVIITFMVKKYCLQYNRIYIRNFLQYLISQLGMTFHFLHVGNVIFFFFQQLSVNFYLSNINQV